MSQETRRDPPRHFSNWGQCPQPQRPITQCLASGGLCLTPVKVSGCQGETAIGSMGSIHLLLIYNPLLLALDNRHRETTHLILIYEQLPNYIIDMYHLSSVVSDLITKHRGSSSFISAKQIRGNKQFHGQQSAGRSWPGHDRPRSRAPPPAPPTSQN